MNRFLPALFLLLSATSPLLAFDVPKPDAKLTSFRLQGLSLREATFSFELTVTNPYPVGLPVDGLTLNFSVEGVKVFSAANQGKFEIPANKKKATTFEVALPYEGIEAAVKNYLEKDWLKTQIDGKLDIALPKVPGLALPKSVSFEYKLNQTIPALKPKVEVLAFSVKGPSEAEVAEGLKKAAQKVDVKAAVSAFQGFLAGKKPEKAAFQPQDIDIPLTLSYTLAVENKARAPLALTSLTYALTVNDQPLVKGSSDTVKREGNRTLITVVNTLRSKDLTEGLRAVFAARKGQYSVTGSASLQVPPEVRKEPVPLAFDERGAFSF